MSDLGLHYCSEGRYRSVNNNIQTDCLSAPTKKSLCSRTSNLWHPCSKSYLAGCLGVFLTPKHHPNLCESNFLKCQFEAYKFFHLNIFPMTLYNKIMPYFNELIHVYGSPQNFTIANFGYPVFKSWLRPCPCYVPLSSRVSLLQSTLMCLMSSRSACS